MSHIKRECPTCAAPCTEDGTPVAMIEFDRLTAEVARLNERCQSWAEDFGSAAGQRDRYAAALRQIVKDADECPMEDMLSAGQIAREALSADVDALNGQDCPCGIVGPHAPDEHCPTGRD